jgi:hypothetical protein
MPEISGLGISQLSGAIKVCFFLSMLTAIIPIIYHHVLDPAWRRIRNTPSDNNHYIY